eukprot:4574126-Prymnesium_polylepis.2
MPGRYLQHFKEIKRRHPAYRIAIFHVYAERAIILDRVAKVDSSEPNSRAPAERARMLRRAA